MDQSEMPLAYLMPECSTCLTSEWVQEQGPELFGSEYHCTNCKAQWVQEC